VHENCSETVLPYYYARSGGNLAIIYSESNFATSEKEYYRNLEICLQLQNSVLKLISKSDHPEDWGIVQHNIGCFYTNFFKAQADKFLSMEIIDKAIDHLELSFQVRNPANALQYWVASCRSLGDALIERSLYLTNAQERNSIQKRAYGILIEAASRISEAEHPNQWDEIQKQLARCSEQRLHLRPPNDPSAVT
jgi:hypothetical protein